MAYPESSSGIFRRTAGKETEEPATMSTAPGRSERMRCLFDFAQTVLGFRLTVNGARRRPCRLSPPGRPANEPLRVQRRG